MLNNGFIVFITETGGSIGNDGTITPPTNSSSASFACNIRTITRQYLTVVEGQTLQAKISVMIDENVIKNVTLNTVKKVSIVDSIGNNLGVFQIQKIEHLKLTNKIKIVV
ncbi:MAG: hypothetical protein IPO21_14435 [Bacteroidales bacterium]|nr:hypothetical protein [Bacteroidales bacterium]